MPVYEISKEFAWSASHTLKGLPVGHPCGRLHGHNYVARVSLSAARLDEHGFVVDYGDLAPMKSYIDDVFDHRHMNDALGGDVNPTAENIARHLACIVALRVDLPDDVNVAVAVSETPKTWATYSETI
jgi:6-pyruvoyltetrahydropterin/6-carboxytetrahydropterin synthase